MKTKNAFLLIFHILTIFLVTLCFRYIPEKKMASLVAASLFLWFPIWVFSSNLKQQKLIYWGHFQFFYFFALPIFLGRIIFWNSDFNQIKILNTIDATQLHKYSQYSYIFMLILSFINLIYLFKKK